MSNLVFFGSDQYSSLVLARLITANHAVQAVITTRGKPDKKTVRLLSNPVKKLAGKHNLKVLYYPPNVEELRKYIDSETLGISASFGRLLPPALLALFPRGLLNLHPSLLPQYRNVAPVPYALALGDPETGVTLARMDEKIDKGKILLQATEPILPTDTTPILLDRLFTLGTDLLLAYLTGSQNLHPRGVNSPLVFTKKLTRASGYLEWPVFQKLLKNEPIIAAETANPLIKLRLTHHPDRQNNILPDLVRALDGYEKVWTTAPTRHVPLNISLTSFTPLTVLLPGKPRPLPYTDFVKYYL